MTLADLLVVMNAGRVEQQGKPIEIYEKPATTFVASFIGAPPMNLLPALAYDGVPNKATTIGFRPEDAEVTKTADMPAGSLSLPANVEAVEPVGAECFLYCSTELGRATVRVRGRSASELGTQCRILIAPEHRHWFAEDGQRIAT